MSTINDITGEIRRKAEAHIGPLMVAVVGPPGSGKSTLAGELSNALGASVILEMDGFHYDNSILQELDIVARKGAPESFDVAGFKHMIERIKSGHAVAAPVFDRALDLSRGSARMIRPEHEFIIVEGNYLLLDEAPWSDLHGFWDLSIALNTAEDVLRERLIHRWLSHGLDVETAHAKALNNDMPNALRVVRSSIPANLTYDHINY